MSKLKYSLQHQEPVEIVLKTEQEYFIGRDSSCDILLEAYKGISRKHIRLYYANGVWQIEKISQHGEFPTEPLISATQFKIGPYEFTFQPEERTSAQPMAIEHSRTLAIKSQQQQDNSSTESQDGFEGTVVGVKKLLPYLKIEWPDRASPEVFQLKGDRWILGRDPKCDIPVEYPEMSRHHFELHVDIAKIYVQDLGSSNGTIVNSEQLPPNVPVLLNSGDCIQIQDLKIYFEWRDPHFQALVPTLQNAPEPKLNTPNLISLEVSADGAAVEQLSRFTKYKNKTTMMRAGLVVAIVMILVAGLLFSDDPKEQQSLSSKNPGEMTLSPSQKAAARDSFQLALHLYKQGKYELCMSELQKLHQIIPQYENSKELEVFCSHGHELVLRQKDRERKDREQQAIQQQIQTVIAECRQKLKPFDAPELHVQCLTPATELDPENHEIQQIIKSAQDFEKQRNEQRKLAANRAEKILNGKRHFEKAQKFQKEGNLKVALAEYESYLRANYPDNDIQEDTARREVSSLKKEISNRVQSRLDLCMQAGAKNQWKIGYLSCEEVLKEDPTNAKARQERDRMSSELKREMKALYEDSVLEESLGNVDTAKEKWKKIKEDNLPFDDYTKKANQKLRKYGIGM